MQNVILKLEHSNHSQNSLEDSKIIKVVSSISPSTFIKLLRVADNKVNPRIATVNRITRSIHETLEISPSLFWFKSKGILISTENFEVLDRNRVRISLSNLDYEGIMDGGHNTFAIAIYIVEKLFGKRLKSWSEVKEYWEKNYEKILVEFEAKKEAFNFSIPVEIITPNLLLDGAVEEFYDNISEICSARNNNVQLKETAKGNQVGFYDYLKEVLDDAGYHRIIWKSGDNGDFKSEDLISLSCLGLIFLKENNLLPNEIRSLNRISIYSQKGKCVDFFNDIMSNSNISDEEKGKFILVNSYVKSALDMAGDIIYFFDKMFVTFPDLYHRAAPGKFGRISSVDNKKKAPAPFGSIDELCDYQYSYGFFYPLICGLTGLMQFDDTKKVLSWRINPRDLDLNKLDLKQYVELIRVVNFDPQKIGKGVVFYNESVSVFQKVE